MINELAYTLGAEPNAIREIFAYGLARKAEIGAKNVFDFSIGNPTVPTPHAVKQAVLELMEQPSLKVHGYTPAQGAPSVRNAIAQSINRRFGAHATGDLIYMAVGAAAGLGIAVKALSEPEDEFIVITPYFPEYKVWIESAGSTCVEVPAHPDTFELDVPAIAQAINARTKGIIINSPNNPVGVVYSEQNLRDLADVLRAASIDFGREIFLISDEPYREIAYEGVEVPFVPDIYPATLICYSYSKSLSLPGERIGYVYVSERLGDYAQRVYTAICGSGRALGFVCAPALFQYVIERCVDVPVDVQPYADNRAFLTNELKKLGYDFVNPQGAFYLWIKALEPDERAFCERAKQHELLLVPSDSFGCHGWARVGYCVDRATIEGAIPAFKALIESYQ